MHFCQESSPRSISFLKPSIQVYIIRKGGADYRKNQIRRTNKHLDANSEGRRGLPTSYYITTELSISKTANARVLRCPILKAISCLAPSWRVGLSLIVFLCFYPSIHYQHSYIFHGILKSKQSKPATRPKRLQEFVEEEQANWMLRGSVGDLIVDVGGFCLFWVQPYGSLQLMTSQQQKPLGRGRRITTAIIIFSYLTLFFYKLLHHINSMLRLLNTTNRYLLGSKASWFNAEPHKPSFGETQTVTLIPGIGIGPEITNSVREVFDAANVPVRFDVIPDFTFENISQRDLLHKNRCILLGVMVPERGVNPKYNDNHKFYKHLDLFANVNLCYSFPNVSNRHNNVDIAVIRENLEGEFSGIEHEVYPGVMESLKVTTRKNSERLLKYAFEFAHLSGRKKVTIVHKANIMKLVDGLFLECARKTSERFPFIKYEEMIVDNCAMQMVKNPSQFDVMVAPNLYGTIISHIAAGITGGVGMTPGACIGNNYALFSQGMPHSGMQIAGKNLANPTSILISSVMMLRYLGLPRFADQISMAIKEVLDNKEAMTKDIRGHHSTSDFTKAVIHHL